MEFPSERPLKCRLSRHGLVPLLADSRDSLRCSISRRWMKDAMTVRDPERKFTNLLIPMFDRLHFFGLMRVAVVKVWPMRVSVNDWLVRVPMCVASGGW